MKKTPKQLALELAELARCSYPVGMDEAAEIFHEEVKRAHIDVEYFGKSIARIAIASALRLTLRAHRRTHPRWLIPAYLFENLATAVWRALY